MEPALAVPRHAGLCFSSIPAWRVDTRSTARLGVQVMVQGTPVLVLGP